MGEELGPARSTIQTPTRPIFFPRQSPCAQAKSSRRGGLGDEGRGGDGSCRRALVFGVLRIPLGLLGVLRIALCAAQLKSVYVEVLVSDFDAGVGVGDEVPVPRGAAVDTGGR